MSQTNDAQGHRQESRPPERTQEVIASLNVAATELVSRIVKAERDVHDQRNAAFRAMNQAALLSDDVERLRAALGTARTLIMAARDECPADGLRDELGRGLALIDEVLVETSESRDC